jgi:hypothetical protein
MARVERHHVANAAQPERAEADEAFGPPEPFSPQAGFMTQPVSSGARWPGADLSCAEPSANTETFACEETRKVPCVAERAHRAAVAEPPVLPDDMVRGRDFCTRADTVVEGFLCNEPVVVSNACRKPNNAFDEFICDDPRMQRLQWAILRETWAIVKGIALGLFRGKP